MTTVFGALDVGSAVGLVLCPPLIFHAGWPSVFWLFAAAGLVWCAIWPRFKPEEPDPESPPQPSGAMLAMPAACTLSLAGVCIL